MSAIPASRGAGRPSIWEYAGLAAPFLITIALLHGLRDQMPAFHGGDETS